MKSRYLHWVDEHGCARRLTLLQRAHRAIAMLLGVSALCLLSGCRLHCSYTRTSGPTASDAGEP